MPSLNKFLLIGFVIGLSTGVIFVATDVFGATQQIFQAGAGYEITTDSAAQSLDITTKATDGGAINITARSTGNAIFIDTANNVGINDTSPTNKLDVSGYIGIRDITVLSSAFDRFAGTVSDIYGNIRVLRSESTLADGMYIGYGGSGGPLRFFSNSGTTEFMTLSTSGNLTVTGTVSVATPTAAGHAATKSYVDSAVVNVGAGRVRIETNRTIGGLQNDTVAVGYFSNDGVGKNIRVYLKAHNGAVIDVHTYEINEVAYTGATTNWLEIPINQNSVSYIGRAGLALDVYRQNIGLTSDPLYMRIRNKAGVGTGTVQVVVEYDDDSTFTELTSGSNTATAFNASTAPAGGALTGYYGNLEWNFPVSGGQGWNVSQGGLFVKNDGNVGIGTNSPAYKLDVLGGYGAKLFKFSASGGASLFGYSDSGGSGITNADPYNSLIYLAGPAMHFYTNATGPRMTIDSAGNVGIGTMAPATKLEVAGTNEIARFSGGTTPYITVGNGNTAGTGGYVQYDDTNNKMYISPHALSTITIDSSGSVGINDSTPTEGTLTVVGTGYFTGTVTVATPTAAGHATTKSYVDTAVAAGGGGWTDDGTVVRLSTVTDSVGIGTPAPFGKLHVLGTAGALGDTGMFEIGDGTRQGISMGYDTTNAWGWIYARSVGAAGRTLNINNTAYIQSAGNVGIGTASPQTKLQVNGIIASNDCVGGGGTTGTAGAGGNTWRMCGIGAANSWIYLYNGAGTAYHDLALGNLWVNGAIQSGTWNGAVITDAYVSDTITASNYYLASNPSGYITAASTLTGLVQSTAAGNSYFTGGNVGVGTTGPNYKLDVAGQVAVDAPSGYGARLVIGQPGTDYPGNSGWSATWNSNILLNGLNSTSISFHDSGLRVDTLRVAGGTFYIGENVGWGTANLDVGSGAGKVNAGTIDPIYTIGGQRYATYVSAMPGVKEEATGVAKLTGEEYVIDFGDLEKGSDLWLFAQTTNLAKEGLANLVAILTPSFDGRVWYEKDEKNLRLVIHGSDDGEVSFRLTAPRFDSDNWPNTSKDLSEGFNLDELLVN